MLGHTQFATLLASIIPTDWASECGLGQANGGASSSSSDAGSKVTAVVVTLLILAMVIGGVVLWRQTEREKKPPPHANIAYGVIEPGSPELEDEEV